MANRNPFGPGLLRFLRELEDNNNRPWFRQNKQRYEQTVREPALDFIQAFAPQLKRISPYLVANPQRVGGSLMRVHRDVRFSKSKLPYKTNVGIQFRHVSGKDVHAPGLYFHIDSSRIFLGMGMWHPDPEALDAVRRRIASKPKDWKKVRDGKQFQDVWALDGDSLQRAPRGFPSDHPMILDLRRKDHIATCRLKPAELTRPDLVQFLAGLYGRGKGYLGWLTRALDLPF